MKFMPRDRIYAGFASLLALSWLVGCHRGRKPIIAIIPETTAQEDWESAHAEAARVASSWNWGTFYNGPSREDDLLRQIQIMDKEVDRGVAGVILAPDHAVALISSVRAAVAKGIPVAIIDSPLAASPKGDVEFVLNDYAAVGRIAAKRIAPRLDARANDVAILGVHPNFLGSLTVADTVRKSLLQEHPRVQITVQPTIFGISEATDAAEELVRQHPNLRAIIALNVMQTRAAIDALAHAGLSRKVVLIGCEQDFDVVYRMRTGDIDAVIAKDTETMVHEAMRWIHGRRQGTLTGETILVPPVLVTRENVDTPEIQKVLAVNGATP